jgi:hypothetical protein
MSVDFYGADKSTVIPANERFTINSAQITSNVAYLDIGLNGVPTGGTIVVQGLPLPSMNGTFTVRAPDIDQSPTIIAYSLTSPDYPYNDQISGVLTYDVTSTSRIISTTITRTDRWAYIGLVNPGATTLGAAYAKITVTCTPNSLNATQAFKIDKAVFRE